MIRVTMPKGIIFAITSAVAVFALSSLSGPAAAQDKVDTSTIVEMSIGSDDAPVTVIEYASFTCPHCARFHGTTFKEIEKNYVETGKVRFVHREVYFDRFGLWAGMVARCGGADRYFGVADIIYNTQSEWTEGGDPATIVENLRRIGRSAGLTDDQLDACLSDATKAQTLVAWYEENAKADGIQSTPSFVIDGKLYSNMSYDEFAEILDAELDG